MIKSHAFLLDPLHHPLNPLTPQPSIRRIRTNLPPSFYSPRSSSGATTTEVLTNLPTFSGTEFGKHKILFLYSLPYHGPMKYECYILEYVVWVPCTHTLTVSENIIATIKIRNNFCYPLKIVIFPILR